jgi:hypothetical protein
MEIWRQWMEEGLPARSVTFSREREKWAPGSRVDSFFEHHAKPSPPLMFNPVPACAKEPSFCLSLASKKSYSLKAQRFPCDN